MKLACIYVAIFLIMLMVGGRTKQRNLFLEWEKFESCPNFKNDQFDLSTVEIYRDDESTISLRGTASLNVDVPKGPLKITATFGKFVNGGSYPVLNYEISDICEKIGEKDTEWAPYVQGLVPVPPDTCPLYKTNFTLANVKSNLNTVPLSKDMVGKYNVILEVHKPPAVQPRTFPGFNAELQRMACYSLDFSVVSD